MRLGYLGVGVTSGWRVREGGGADMVGVSMTNRVDTEYVEQRQLICRRLGLFPQMRSCICEAECRPDDGQMVSRGKSLFKPWCSGEI